MMKKFKFLGLLSVLSLFISFGNCTSNIDVNTNGNFYTYTTNGTSSFTLNSSVVYCFRVVNTASSCSFSDVNGSSLSLGQSYKCLSSPETVQLSLTCNNLSTSRTLNIHYGQFPSCPTCPTCPTCPVQYTSLECQSEYNLIPVESVDSDYCENNNLCPVNTGEILTGLSTLYINDIRHQSMPFIYVNIPEEFSWDYSTGINDFTIDISGYNVDTDYIAGIIDTQNYKPDESDFNKIITDVIPLFVPGLVIILFLYFVFRLIKKIF